MPLKLPLVLAAIVWTFALLVSSAKGNSGQVIWTAPTPADQSRITVSVGEPVSVTLTAAVAVEAVDVHIDVVGAPAGAVFNSSDGGSARATFEWAPQAPGDYTVLFTASTGAGFSAPARGILIHVTPAVRYPHFYRVGETNIASWATVWKRSVVRSQPSSSAPAVTTLETRTTDGTQNIVLVLDGLDVSPTETWYRVRLAILPNNSTGWVRGGNLGRLFAVHTHLYVDLARMTATLKRDGVAVFEAPVGIGRPASPTPRGEFYVRNKLAGFDDPFYGPVAFGTNARSAVLTDWPDGGFVGVHGTNRPALIPGRVSHGCIDLRNGALLRLARLMPVGTPLTIR